MVKPFWKTKSYHVSFSPLSFDDSLADQNILKKIRLSAAI